MDIYSVTPPQNDSPYVLFVTRGMSMTGPAYGVFAVDRVAVTNEENGGYATAYLGDQIVTMFPAGTPFLLVPRSQYKVQTTIEAATEGKAEEDALKEIYKNSEAKGGEKLYTGRYE